MGTYVTSIFVYDFLTLNDARSDALIQEWTLLRHGTGKILMLLESAKSLSKVFIQFTIPKTCESTNFHF